MTNKLNVFYKGKESELPLFFSFYEIKELIQNENNMLNDNQIHFKRPYKSLPLKPISKILLINEQKNI